MNKTPENAVVLPNEQERRQVFCWLRQVSSWTAWNRILGYYKSWTDVTEASIKEASKKGWENRTGIPDSDYRLILKGLAHFDEGVRRLRTGDKRVFKYDANGEFVMAERPEDHWSSMLWRLDLGESEIDYDRTPHWIEFKRTLTELNQAWGECSPEIIESGDLHAPTHTFFNEYLKAKLEKMTFPTPLSEVPIPTEIELVRSGKPIPCSGIWEPVHVPKPKGFSMFRESPTPQLPLQIVGTMAYLHGGSHAPNMAAYGEADGLPTTWLLLWKDDRYADGSIPAEEAGYVFLMPEPPAAVASPQERSPELRLVYADTGEPAPQGGRWLVEHDIHASIDLQKGEPLPRHHGESVRWVLADTWR